jgi:hypothetical protein
MSSTPFTRLAFDELGDFAVWGDIVFHFSAFQQLQQDQKIASWAHFIFS